MDDPKKLLEQFAQRMETILSKESDPQPLMAQILEAAQLEEIVDATGAIRTSSPTAFVMDLLTDNPQAREWAEKAKFSLRPLAINDSDALIEAIVSV